MKINIQSFLEHLEVEVADYQVPVVDLIAVQTRDPYKVLVATILSARTKDETTAKAAKRLFKEAPNIIALARLETEKIQKLIYPVGFYKNKAKYLSQLPDTLAEFDHLVPDEMEKLLKLPGVGRKTANLVLAVAFDKPAICVDTHVHRIMNIWGYVETKKPEETEKALRKKLPGKYWKKVNSILVAFGQSICKPVGPRCDICQLVEKCPALGVKPRRVSIARNSLKLISWNVNGLRAAEKKGFIDVMQGLGPDIMAIQETKAQPEQLSDAIKTIPGYKSYFESAEKKGYSGVAVYSRVKPLTVTKGIGEKKFDMEGRTITLEFADFFLVNAYFPNSQHGLKRLDYKLDFNKTILKYLKNLASKKTTIVCGDLNIAHKPIDLANPKANKDNPGYSLPEREWMDEFIAAGWVDSFRVFNQEPEQYSWWSYRFNARARNIGWRIDYFVIDQKSKKRLKNASILQAITGSDHCPVEIEIEVK
jgi:exodeoxyribonuclease III